MTAREKEELLIVEMFWMFHSALPTTQYVNRIGLLYGSHSLVTSLFTLIYLLQHFFSPFLPQHIAIKVYVKVGERMKIEANMCTIITRMKNNGKKATISVYMWIWVCVIWREDEFFFLFQRIIRAELHDDK